jgi:thiol-disulfide isomerase/thioredoxin
LLGTVYLLDFWASWCKPCIAELPHLREATEQFSKCGFRVVAVAVDDARADVAALQATEPMPWLVSLAERGRSDEINRRFEVFGLPSSILVGTEGNAIATSDTLRGPALLEQLEKVCSAENER